MSNASQNKGADNQGFGGIQIHRGPGWLKSLALYSDLLILGDAAEVCVTGAWISIRTPSLPQLRLGNAILSPRPPGHEDVDAWVEHLERQVGESAARYGRIAWEGGQPNEDVYRAFRSAGFEPYDSLSMQTSVLHPRTDAAAVPTRMVRSDAEWRDLFAFHIHANQVSTASDQEILTARLNLYRTAVEEGNGAWFTTYADGRVAGCCGIALGDGLARLQGLETATERRRSGVALALVKAASEWALQHDSSCRLVSVVDPDYHARRLFQSVGFQPHDLAYGVIPMNSRTSPSA